MRNKQTEFWQKKLCVWHLHVANEEFKFVFLGSKIEWSKQPWDDTYAMERVHACLFLQIYQLGINPFVPEWKECASNKNCKHCLEIYSGWWKKLQQAKK